MSEDLPEEKAKSIDLIARDLNTAIKNSLLYSADHPIFLSAIKNLKVSLDKWFSGENQIDLGISPDNLLLKGSYVRQGDANYRDAAGYLHARGIVALSISKDIDIGEMVEFFKFIKNDVKTVRQMGGVVKNVPPCPNLKIKEVDYSSLLSSAKDQVTDEERNIWSSLSTITAESAGSKLPESKVEFLVDFLKNPESSAHVLNKIYKQAVAKLDNKSALVSIRASIARINKYFQKYEAKDTKDAQNSLVEIIANLDPDLVVRLCEQAKIDGKNFAMAEEVTRGFSDDMIADFMASLVGRGGVFNENMLKMFEKLVPQQDRRDSIAPMLIDKLLEKNILDKNALSKLQLSIKEIFNTHPDNDFMSQMYRMTVETFVDKAEDSAESTGILSTLVNAYKDFVEEKNLKRENIKLLLNIVWLENDAEEFRKFSSHLIDLFPQLVGVKDIETIRQSIELFTKKVRPEQAKYGKIAIYIKEMLDRIVNNELINKIVSFIPGTPADRLDDLAYILMQRKDYSAGLLLNAFLSDKDPVNRKSLNYILSQFGADVSGQIGRRLEGFEDMDFSAVKELFKMLKDTDPQKAGLSAKRLIMHKDAKVRLLALDNIDTSTVAEELNIILDIFKKEKDEMVQNKALVILVKAGNKDVIDKLFAIANKSPFKNNQLLKLVKLCGDHDIQDCSRFLREIFLKKSFFRAKSSDELRIAAIVNLTRISSPEAMELADTGLNDRRKAVKRTCRMLLDSNKNKDGEKKG